MKMTQENMKRFESMVNDFMEENSLRVQFDHDWDRRQTHIRVDEFETRATRNMVVDWDTKKSLSQAGAIIFTYISREFDLDGRNSFGQPKIQNVIFNDPATIVLWEDGTKTVVKCQEGDIFSKETGLALCIAKKALGNESNFNNVFKKWIPEEEQVEEFSTVSTANIDPLDISEITDSLKERFINDLTKRFDEVLKKYRGGGVEV